MELLSPYELSSVRCQTRRGALNHELIAELGLNTCLPISRSGKREQLRQERMREEATRCVVAVARRANRYMYICICTVHARATSEGGEDGFMWRYLPYRILYFSILWLNCCCCSRCVEASIRSVASVLSFSPILRKSEERERKRDITEIIELESRVALLRPRC